MSSYTGDLRWDNDVVTPGDQGVGGGVQGVVAGIKAKLLTGEDLYQELLELYTFAGGTDQDLADQLFKEQWEARSESQANAEELLKTQDAIAAMLSAHELFDGANNQPITTKDRLSDFRRMS